jgi:hypothetical protein
VFALAGKPRRTGGNLILKKIGGICYEKSILIKPSLIVIHSSYVFVLLTAYRLLVPDLNASYRR